MSESPSDSDRISVLQTRRVSFYEEVSRRIDAMGNNSGIIQDTTYNDIVELLGALKECTTQEERAQIMRDNITLYPYRLLQKFDIIINSDSTRILIYKQRPGAPLDSCQLVVRFSSIFDVVREIHEVEAGNDHRKSKTLHKRVSAKYGKSIPRWICEIFPDFCSVCVRARHRVKAKAGHQPILTRGMNVQVQLDIIDYQSMPDGPFKYVLNYQDHGTKFCQLRPLAHKSQVTVAQELVNIFCIFGPPSILQVDNGREFSHAASKSRRVPIDEEFCNAVITEIKTLWPGTVLVTGKPRHSESNGGVERRNRTVEEKIANWMQENNSTHWASSLPFIQWRCNAQQHKGIGNRTPYHLAFGQNPLVGISNLPISQHLLSSLQTECDVSNALGLSQDVPIDEAIVGNLPSPVATRTPHQPKQDKQPTSSQLTTLTRPMFCRTPDLTGRFIAQLLSKCIVKPPSGGRPYFGWKGVGYQRGICFNSVPSHVNLPTFMSLFMVNNLEAPTNESLMLLNGDTSEDKTNTETLNHTEIHEGNCKKPSRQGDTEESQHNSEENTCRDTDGDKPFLFVEYGSMVSSSNCQ